MATRVGQQARTAVEGNGVRLRPPAARRRQLPWVVIGVVCIVGGSLAGALWARSVSDREAVLVMARAVPAGQVIEHGDVKVSRVAGDADVRAIASGNVATVVGQRAAVDLLPGTLLVRAHVGNPAGLGSGKAMVGLALKPGQLPTAKLGPGNQVQVVDTGAAPGAVTPASPAVLASAGVAGVEEAESDAAGKTVVVSLIVNQAEAPAIAAAGAAGRAALVLVG
jgi:SAF domain